MASQIQAPGLRDPTLRRVVNPKFKDDMYWTHYSAETNSEFFQAEITLGPKGGIPLHWHIKNDEIFTAGPKGLGLQLDDREFILQPGESARVPVRHNHRFFNPLDEDVTFTVRGEPGSDDDGFAKGIYVMYGLAADGLTDGNGVPKSFIHLSVFMYLTDTWFSGWKMFAMGPLFRVAYAYARMSGEEERLIRRYWVEYKRKPDAQATVVPY